MLQSPPIKELATLDFQAYLDYDVTLPVDKVQSSVDCLVQKLNAVILKLKKIFLVEDLIDSLKFAAGSNPIEKRIIGRGRVIKRSFKLFLATSHLLLDTPRTGFVVMYTPY